MGTKAVRDVCGVCGKDVAVRENGLFYRHDDGRSRCWGVGRTPDETRTARVVLDQNDLPIRVGNRVLIDGEAAVVERVNWMSQRVLVKWDDGTGCRETVSAYRTTII